MSELLRTGFLNPPKEYRPCPFWSWNDRLTGGELAWQVRDMSEKGFGGYFMHSRIGLITSYLSREWMDRIRTCVQEGRKADMESWLYDEDKWPSGFAGGYVPAQSEQFRAKGIEAKEIRHEDINDLKKNGNLVAIFSLHVSDQVILSVRQIHPKGEEPIDGGRLFAFVQAISPTSNWYNGESYVDLLDPKVTEAFLATTYDAYASDFKEDFGEFMPGIFTDEPNYAGAGQIPWTTDFEDYFLKKNGYRISENLPLVYFKGASQNKIRHDFWKTITTKFLECFTIPVSKRCDELGLKLTGHYLSEDSLHAQIRVIGAAMPHYQYMHIPGIDHLGRNIRDPLTLKQVSSVAHQFNRKRIMCEIFGVSGHSMTFEDQKWIADFHFALGITFLVPHLTLYSMTGQRKRDYPPTFSYHQPYWKYMRLMNDYFARCSFMISQGKFFANILLLHPIASAWSCFSATLPGEDLGRKNSEVQRYNAEFTYLLETLLGGHRDFDLGDELIIEKHAAIEGERIRIGEQTYGLVVVPPSLTWSCSTLRLLRDYTSRGGKILFVGQFPTHVDGEPSRSWEQFLAKPNVYCSMNLRDAALAAIDRILDRDVSILDRGHNEIPDIFCHHRVLGFDHIYFLSNTNRQNALDATILLDVQGDLSEWDAETGTIRPVRYATHDGHIMIQTIFPPVSSKILVVRTSDGRREGQANGDGDHIIEEMQSIPLHGRWKSKRLHPNSLPLDYCRYKIESSEWSQIVPVWKARKAILDAVGLSEFEGIQPWAISHQGKKAKPLNIETRASFEVDQIPSSLHLIVEKLQRFHLKVNDHPISTHGLGWHWDKQFGRVDIASFITRGENTIELSCAYDLDTEIEDIYLVGDFAVERRGTNQYVLTSELDHLEDGDWTQQGYPFYAGNMIYDKEIGVAETGDRKFIVSLIDPHATLFVVTVNGKEAGYIWKQPWDIDVTDHIKKGHNTLQIEAVGSLRNTFGPLHHDLGDRLPWTGPAEFVDQAHWTDQYQVAPYGLLRGAEFKIIRQRTDDPPKSAK